MVKILVAVLFLFTFSSSPAITVTNASGVARERESVKGKIVRIDQNSITIHWFPGSSGKMGTHQLSNVDDVVLLDAQHRFITKVDISRGTVNQSLAHLREIFRPAIVHSAYAFVLVHNL